MSRLIKLKQPVIVEGKYDKITLENVIDALIITTEGFGIFKNKEKRDMIRLLAQKNGIIVMTDSDNAGNMIRSYIKNIVGSAQIINVYIPQLSGKEKRKSKAGKEGFLGVEGMKPEVIKEALKLSGVMGSEIPMDRRKITKTDMYLAGLSGSENSSKERQKLLKTLNLPQNLSPNSMLDTLNTLFTYEEFVEVTSRCLKQQTKN